MPARHPRSTDWPTQWLMTDERMGNQLIPAIRRLPRGAGIVLRHYRLTRQERLQLGLMLRAEARRRSLTFAVARDVMLARRLSADMVHQPDTFPGLLPHSCSVHSVAEANIARRAGADIIFVSPLFPTQSHPGRAPMQREEIDRILAASHARAIALGGMDAARFAEARRQGFHGYAGIDCWLRT